MSIDQIDKIDFISTKSDGNIELTISDHIDWIDENEHFIIIQDKLNSYLNFIESGQLLEEYPNSKNKNIDIKIMMKFPPSENAIFFLYKCKKIINEANINFYWKTLK